MRGLPAEGALRAERPPSPPPPHAAELDVVGDRVDVPARRLAERGHQLRLAQLRRLADGLQPERVQLARRRRPDAPDPLDRQREEELELALGLHDEQPVGLRGPARDLGQDLRPGDADAERQPGVLAHLPAQPRGELGRRLVAARHVEERLLERPGLDDLREAVEDGEHRLAGRHDRVPVRVGDDHPGHRRCAFAVAIPLRTPCARAS